MVADAVHSQIEEISEGSSSKVPEPSGSKRTPRLRGQSETEGPGSEALQRQENIPSESFGAMRTPDMEMTHEERDIFWECLEGIEDGPDPDASFIFDEAENLLKHAVSLHRREFDKSRTELARCEAKLKKLMEERDNLKILYIKNKGEISDLRAELAKAGREQTELIEKGQQKGELVEQLREELKMQEEEILARSRKIEELEAKSAAEIAKAKSDAEALVSSYRVDVEASNTRAKEISVAADAATLLSDDEDSASGSESGGDEYEVPEEEVPEDVAPEDASPKDVASK
uniref:Testis-specific gene 10 protein-like n=1 Tax=Nicotiana sylvestris TaxID=4096 RepID=A0A1U7VV32_NICSY|nr:PREDICTED: testis-specific gene 10 protein-like [Nicotiana sylvestris]